MPLKMDLGGSWAPFGRGLGRSGASFGGSLATFGRFLGVRNVTFFKHWPKMGSKGASGFILKGICEDFGRIWEGFGKISPSFQLHLGRFGQDVS